MTDWIIEWLPKNDRQAEWKPFGLPHSLDEIEEKLKDVEKRMPDSHWRIVPMLDKKSLASYHQTFSMKEVSING